MVSGGELSRLALAIQYIKGETNTIPTQVFDEIDTGVSGEISDKMASIMKDMSQYMQVFTITHLPQIAAKGTHHFKVFKQDFGTTTTTQLTKLNSDERLEEIAQMLGGKEITETAKLHAQQLMN